MTERQSGLWHTEFLDALRRSGDVSAAAREVGIHATTAYAARRRKPQFAADWEKALRAPKPKVAKADPHFYTVEEIADILRVRPERVRLLILAGEIKATKPRGRRWLIPRDEMQRLRGGRPA